MLVLRNNEQFPMFSSFFNDFFENDWMPWWHKHYSTTNTSVPAVNISENTEGYSVEMAAPGLEKDDFKIELNRGVLTISSEKKAENTAKENDMVTRHEFSYQSFTRSFSLPETADADKVSATYNKGILYVTIPKKEEAKAKPIKTIAIE